MRSALLGALLLATVGMAGCRSEPCGHAVEKRDALRLETVSRALRAWHAAHGRWPTADEGLMALVRCPAASASGIDCERFPATGYATSDALRDVCGRSIHYALVGGQPRLSAPGPDGEVGTGDDRVIEIKTTPTGR